MDAATTIARLKPVPMQEAVGYPALDCTHQALIDDRLVAKHNRLFLITDEHGNVSPAGHCSLGLFHDDTRILSHYRLEFSAGPVSLLSSRETSMYGIQADLAISDRDFGGDAWDPKNSIHIRREIVLSDRLRERVTLTNFLTRPIELTVRFAVGCDFADIFEVRGWKREQRGQYYEPSVDDRSICFAYRGADGALLRSRVHFAAAPDVLTSRGAEWRLRLGSNQSEAIEWQVLPDQTPDPGPEDFGGSIGREAAREEYAEWREKCAAWMTDVAEFDAALEQALIDLRGLYVEIHDESVISAGIPWYSTVFGRDSIITSLQALPLTPNIARDTLRYLARHQGTREDRYTEEQPGRIMHELRRGELARAGEIPHVPYYGTVDATPLWLVLLHETWRWTGDDQLARELLPHAERALAWIDDYGDIDGDGFVEYHRTSEKGLLNQGWKDSGDGVPFPDGRLPEPPIALVEVQGYVCDAKFRMAQLFSVVGETERAQQLRDEAEALKLAIRERFWLEESGTFALALDGRKTPIPTATSNAGHLLWSRVTTAAQSERLARQLLSEAMYSGWGIRTLSADHAVYNPMSYHNGSIWPHDNAIIALGLALNGRNAAVLPVMGGLHDVAAVMPNHRLPELFCGMARNGTNAPVQYPVSCIPQAWASGALFMLLQAVTGILPDAPAGCLHIRQPVLPPFLKELRVSDLRVGRSRVSLAFHRKRQRTFAQLLEVKGEPLNVVIELA